MIDLYDWKAPLAPLFADERYQQIRAFLKSEYSSRVIYPDMHDIFNCFRFTPYENVGRRTDFAFRCPTAFKSLPRS